MEKIRFRTLGSVELRTGTRELHTLLVQPKRVALLAYLCIAGRNGLLRRDTLLPLFWPEFDDDRARAALRRALHFLRATLGDDLVVTRGNDEVGISGDAVSCDAVELEVFIAAGDHSSALECYRGPFLDGLNATESSAEFEQWIDAQRMRLRSAALHSALHVAREAEAAGSLPKALELARRAREIDSLDEVALRASIDLLSKSGNRTAAIRAYDDFARDAARLELQPSDETVGVIAAMRLGSERSAPPAERDAAASATPAPVGRSSRIPGEAARDAPIGYHEPSPVSRSPVRWILAGAALTTLAAAILAFASRMQSPPPDSERVILVLPFENRTGDSTLAPLGGMAADWVTQGLMSISLARVVLTQTVMQSAREITLAGPKAGDRERVRQLVAATGARILVTGAYYRQSDSLIFQARVSDAQSGEVLRTVAPSAGLVSLPLEAVDRLRKNSLAALASVLDARVEPFARAGSPPPSYESYVEYVVGSDLFVQGSYRPAIQHLTHSFAIDTTYVQPYLLAAIAQNNLGNRAVADTMLHRLETRKDRLALFDTYSLEWLRAVIDGDRMAALVASRKAGALAPGSFPDITTAAAAQHVNRLGESRTILERIDPNRPDVRGWMIYWVQLATTYHLLSEYDREMAAAQRARETNRQSVQGMFLEARARVGRRDIAGVMTVVSEAETSAPSAGSSPGMLWRVAGELRWHGDTAAGTQVLRRAIGVQRSRAPSGQAPANDASLARLLYWVGDVAGADTIARRLVDNDSTDLEAMGLLGLIAAKQGRVDDATRCAAALAAHSPRYLDGRHTFLRAGIAAQLGQRDRSVQLLKEALAQGMLHNYLHASPELEVLRGFVPFDDLIRPRQ